jgi:peroxiredoxin
MVDLQSLQEKFKDRNLEILSLNQGEDADTVRQFITRKQYSFHVLLDSNQVSAQYGVRAIPSLVLIGKDGVIKWLQVGYAANDNDLEKQVENLIAK